ncbi:SDR family NAD(P)-dependent oxidoreductase [Allohahella marinimesophila]|uniref:SDR family NAD(P)-dependent oxidoreductase n=1 Tax=Allohahella marinimesophila TaxID=1054972 RepID=A0ABP7PIA8_9GAMM
MSSKPIAVVTGASTGIGYELALCCAKDGYDLVVCANELEIDAAAGKLRQHGAVVEPVQADLGSKEGVDKLWSAIRGRQVDALLANAGRGLGGAFLDQDFDEAKNVVDVNVSGTISLVQKVGRQMRDRNSGRILITGSIAGFIPGTFHAVYNGTKAFLDSFAEALRNELKDTEVTVTCLMPGLTDTLFFDRAGMQGTAAYDAPKEDPAKVAKVGYEAMQKGDGSVVSGFMNKVQTTFAGIIPDSVLAKMHRRLAEPQDSKA